MKKILLLSVWLTLFISCKSSNGLESSDELGLPMTENKKSVSDIVLGAERIETYLPNLLGKRVALVVNQTSTIGATHLVDTLRTRGVNVVTVFAPEHGFRGDHSAGAIIKNGVDVKSGLPVISLYGKNKKPTDSMLEGVDVVLFDIQDVGVRFYTYISTMHYVMEACAENNKQVVVLDRPNPNGFYIDGPILEREFKSFIGMHPIPLVHGLTVAELALMINGEFWLKDSIQCDLTVVSCLEYEHTMLYKLPIKPSPNLPNMNSVYLYPYLGLFEGTNVSIGRGTNLPFQLVGRPGFNGTYSFTPEGILGVSENPKYKGQLCKGELVKDVIDNSLFMDPKLNLAWLILFYSENRMEDGPYFKDFFYKLAGTKSFRTDIEQGMTAMEIRETWAEDLTKYKEMRKKYLLYP